MTDQGISRRRPSRSSRLLLGAALLLPSFAFASAPRYDVSYLWHATLAGALQRRQDVAKALGPTVARKLRVVAVDDAFAVVYVRRGSARAASRAAAAQSRLLKRASLGKAWSLPSRAWREAPLTGPVGAAAPAAKPKKILKPAETPAAADAGPIVARSVLESLLDEHVKELRRQGRLASDERTAWAVYDLTSDKTLVEINADLELQAASLVKPFLALAFMSKVDKGALVYDDESRRQMTKMIQVSDNAAADWVMRRLGGPATVERLLHEEFAAVLPGVQIKEYIPVSGRTYRNKATARDYSRFLLALWRDELPGSKEIKRLMALPKRDRLHTGVPLPDDVEVYDKTGTTSRLCGDIGVLSAKGPDGRSYSYTLVGIIEKQSSARNYARWMRSRGDVIRYVSYLVYRNVGALHGFASAR